MSEWEPPRRYLHCLFTDVKKRGRPSVPGGAICLSEITSAAKDIGWISGSVAAAVQQVIAGYGAVDILVNTAAPPASTLDPAKDQDPAQVLDAFDAKTVGYLRVVDAVLPHMREAGFGRIINISGQNAFLSRSVTSGVSPARSRIAGG